MLHVTLICLAKAWNAAEAALRLVQALPENAVPPRSGTTTESPNVTDSGTIHSSRSILIFRVFKGRNHVNVHSRLAVFKVPAGGIDFEK